MLQVVANYLIYDPYQIQLMEKTNFRGTPLPCDCHCQNVKGIQRNEMLKQSQYKVKSKTSMEVFNRIKFDQIY